MKLYKLFIATAACLFTMASYAYDNLSIWNNTAHDLAYYCIPSGISGVVGTISPYNSKTCSTGDYGMYFGAYDNNLTLAQIQAITVHTLSYDGPMTHYFDYFDISQGQAAVIWGCSNHRYVGVDGNPYSSIGVCATAQGAC
jgi:hypothetical protein